jgi:hypothetical protein
MVVPPCLFKAEYRHINDGIDTMNACLTALAHR